MSRLFPKKILPWFIAFLAVAVVSAAFLVSKIGTNVKSRSEKKEHVVELSENGFYPPELTIAAGDSVKFTTTRTSPFWPASNLHPTHTIFPEFDPKRPLAPDESWSFRFDAKGEWRYHDHLRPQFTATIAVGDAGAAGKASADDCLRQTAGADRLRCAQELLAARLTRSGIAAAFGLLAELYRSDPLFAAECHGFVHEIGKAAYREFRAGQRPSLPRETAFCGYGFYHGFMETLLQAGGSLAAARRLCDSVGAELAASAPGARNACFHGIGHGLGDQHDARFSGDIQAMLDPALRVCDSISKTRLELYLCSSGVFNAIEILSSSGQYGLSIAKADPFQVCRNQEERFRNACYTNMIPAVLAVTDNRFSESAQFVETIGETEYAVTAVEALAAEQIRLQIKNDTPTLEDATRACRGLGARLRIPCIRGLLVGLMKYGPPETEYEGALEFCRSALLSGEERESCFHRLLSNEIHVYYSPVKARNICSRIEAAYQKYCR